jgi:hypothetical protein
MKLNFKIHQIYEMDEIHFKIQKAKKLMGLKVHHNGFKLA